MREIKQSLAKGMVLVLLSYFQFVHYSEATDDLAEQEKALNVIGDFAGRICKDPPLEGRKRELSATGKAELGGFIKKLTDLGIEGAGKYQGSKYQGLLQEDILAAIKDSINCRLQVFEGLKDKLLAIPSDNEGKLKQLLKRAASSTTPSSPAIQANIIFPENNESVDEFITVEGTVAGDVKNAHLWVVSKAKHDLLYFPQGGKEIPPINSNWSISGVRIGGIGVPHELVVVQANEIMHEAFQLYFEIGLEKGKWIGFNHIAGTKRLARVTVVRR